MIVLLLLDKSVFSSLDWPFQSSTFSLPSFIKRPRFPAIDSLVPLTKEKNDALTLHLHTHHHHHVHNSSTEAKISLPLNVNNEKSSVKSFN